MKKILIPVALLLQLNVFAQDEAPKNWFNLDPTADKVYGVSTEKTYAELLKGRKSKTVIVGVIDSGVDFDHEDLKDVMWTNEKEIPGNGIDDDKNGYIDDIHGWSFLGGKDGKNINLENLEIVRLIRDMKPKFEGKNESDFKGADKKEFHRYQSLKIAYEKKLAGEKAQLKQIQLIYDLMVKLNDDVKKSLGVEKVTAVELEKFEAKDPQQTMLKAAFMGALEGDMTLDFLIDDTKEGLNHFKESVDYNLNMDFNPRKDIIGDDEKNSYERNYGSNDVKGPDCLHGTHVAGIIAASRNNNLGISGVADNVKIMAIRAIPNGDERDKDVANAILYAVDNGATIINMSFGKAYSYDKAAVDAAVKYAEKKGVLFIHAAGNDHNDIDTAAHYPCKKYEKKKGAKNWLDVGASSWETGENIPATFSNYGKKLVDVFAPGVDIYSCKPYDNSYINESGTSMACPVTAGVAAVLKSYFPELSAKQIKKIIIESSLKDYKEQEVNRPGTKNKVPFKNLSNSGGIVNLYSAVKMALTMVK